MGNEQSSELSPEEREADAQLRAQIRAETEADLDRCKAKAVEKIVKEQQQAEVNKSNVVTSSPGTPHATNVNRTTIPSQVNKEQTSSTTMAIRSLEASQEEGEIVEIPEPTQNDEDILKDFNPRKQPRVKDPQISEQSRRQTNGDIADSNETLSIDVPAKSNDTQPVIQASPSKTRATKRPPPSQNVYADERRATLSSLPKIAKRSSVSSPKSPDRGTRHANQPAVTGATVETTRPPRWYEQLKERKTRDPNDSNGDTILTSLRAQINKAQTSSHSGNVPKDVPNSVRTKLHTLTFVPVNEHLLKRNRMLSSNLGLPQIFSDDYSKGVKWPFDIKVDAKELYKKWSRRVFETDLMRGINFSVKAARDTEGKSSGDSVNPAYKISAKYHGNGDLLNGQWWPMQICALRDGAHGEMIAGISGEASDGAYSVVMSGGHDYVDEDYGDEVRYCGTDSKDGAITENTRRLLESVGNQPVRLIRSHNLDSPFAPKLGFRYDGLYEVVSSKNLDGTNSLRQRHVFKLVRRRDQDPIRGGDGPETRPTAQEIQAYKEHRRFSGRE